MHHHHFHHGENDSGGDGISKFQKREDPPKRNGNFYAVHPDDFHD